jgi:excisionase family DNA binding protein
MTPAKPQPLMSISQVADALHVSTKTVRRMIARHELRHHRLGRGGRCIVRVSQEDLRAYVNGARA